jgi:CheY-like chemotaxis protein
MTTPSNATNRWVLVVEDDDDNREVLVEFISGAGFPVKGAASGAEALEILRIETPCLVLADLYMKDMDGRQLLKLARALLKTAMPPFVFTTGAHPSKLEDISGVILPKPFDLDNLLRVVQHHCDGQDSPAPHSAS